MTLPSPLPPTLVSSKYPTHSIEGFGHIPTYCRIYNEKN